MNPDLLAPLLPPLLGDELDLVEAPIAVFKNGREAARHSGVLEPARFNSWVRTHA